MFGPFLNGGLFANVFKGNLGQQVANGLNQQPAEQQVTNTAALQQQPRDLGLSSAFRNFTLYPDQPQQPTVQQQPVVQQQIDSGLRSAFRNFTLYPEQAQQPVVQQQPVAQPTPQQATVAPAVQPSPGSGLPFNNLTGDEMQRAMAFANRRFMPFFGSPFGGGGFGRMSPYGFNQLGGFGFQSPYQQQFVNQNSLANMFGRGLFSSVPFRMF